MTGKHLLSEIVAGLDGVSIPDDIMKAANECVSEFRWNNDNRWHLFVARALLAERERMRSIAAYADRLEKALERISSPTQSTDLLWWQIEARAALEAQPHSERQR